MQRYIMSRRKKVSDDLALSNRTCNPCAAPHWKKLGCPGPSTFTLFDLKKYDNFLMLSSISNLIVFFSIRSTKLDP